MTTLLITGGAGFIGSHLARRFLSDGYHVRVLDNLSSGKRANLAGVLDDVELIEGDIRDPDTCLRAAQGAQAIFHQAARPSVPLSIAQPELSHTANIDGTFNVLMAARDAGVQRVIFAASSSAYGDADEPVKHEGLPPRPKSPYALQKLTGEYYMQLFAESYGLETLSLRYFNVFGPRQDPKSQYAAAIPAFATHLLRGEAPTVYGDGTQTRDFTYIDNVVHGNALALTAPNAQGQVINVACGESISVNDVIQLLNEVLGTAIQPVYAPTRPGDVMHSLADISRARQLLGYEVLIPFRAGLEQAVAWYREAAAGA